MALKTEAAPSMTVVVDDGTTVVKLTHDQVRWIANDIDKIGHTTAICADLRTLGKKLKAVL